MRRIVLLFVFCFTQNIQSNPIFYPDFDISMGKDHEYFASYFSQVLVHENASHMLDWFRSLYEKNRWDKLSPSKTVRIPKIIHQIWLGSQLPEKFAILAATWPAHHPDWQYKLWTDADIADLKLENQEAYDRAINYAERSDIARYEILYRFGGLYVDTDCECFQPFDELHYYYDFYAGLEFPCMALFLRPIIVPNALIASIPGHPIMRGMIDTIMTQKIKPELQHDIVAKTGPLLFSDVVMKYADQAPLRDIIFPASFFYPIDKKIKDKTKIKKIMKPETFSIHHWAGSWILKEEAFVPGIKIKCRQEGNTLKFTISDERQQSN